ncbi:hypothetical protein AZ78_2223 [Lysobacter capsici AZ78]|uniref:Uncharacterized protein n=1 Tax=Lysobacter capsici AZ78 TaxID=1444315 RepID=A0A120AGI8_9GAMM|nr:hypothetical protein AZ78_2223 [Lysobacter capsici AZ78]
MSSRVGAAAIASALAAALDRLCPTLLIPTPPNPALPSRAPPGPGPSSMLRQA